ncbi:uncharacterized protein PRCAT00006002001 [Priceomyces carsonii]|uniref:uncharacterized protein n=1 Tax=Priceomyces carsonii TaxID=28549 RepID=UPI002ED8444B|nr:unnamed protein product [Priceomyces carsonii]
MSQVIWNSDIDVYNPQVIPSSVAKCISKYLSITDLLSFALVSKNTYKTVNDPNLWISKLRELGVWNNKDSILSAEELKKIDFSWSENPLTCFDRCISSPKVAKFQVLKINNSLLPYYRDFYINKPFNRLKIFKVYHTPEEQAKILNNLLKFNKIDAFDESRILVRDKINALLEIFENAILRELEIHYDIHDYERARLFVEIMIYLKNQQTLIDFFLQKTVFDNESTDIFNLELLHTDTYFTKITPTNNADGSQCEYDINLEELNKFKDELADLFNHQAEVIDLIFPASIPMMYKLCEELISNQLSEVIMLLIDASKERGVYLKFVPYLYELLTTKFIEKLNSSKNLGLSYHQLIKELIDMMYESFGAEYIREEIQVFQVYSNDNILQWKDSLSKREAETSNRILKHVKNEAKNDFLSSFKKVFTMNSSSNGTEETPDDDKSYSEMQAKTKILSENLKSLNKILSPELVLNVINEAKLSLNRLLKFKEYSIASFKSDVYSSAQEIFISVIDTIGTEHIKPGFTKALAYLQNYNPNDAKTDHQDSFVEPLIMFFDLINIADLIIQMIDIFYKEEIIHRQIVKNENSILNQSLQSKKKLEGLVDKYVADGLNIGIEVLVNEIENVYKMYSNEEDYNPPPGSTPTFGATEAAKHAVKILDDNIDVLVDSTDKYIVEVFQQEIAERFFQIVVKSLKKSTISVSGATTLICDLNLYYDFMRTRIKTNKKLIMPYYQALKKVGNIYIISGDNSRSIGKLVSDLSKFNGIFEQEEIYEFVQRRLDWLSIRKDVEKVMYGFGLGDCTIV